MSKPTRDQAEAAVRTILEYVGEDSSRDGLVDTPARVIRAWDELLGGYEIDAHEILSRRFDLDDPLVNQSFDEMILSRDIPFTSFCEHHQLPFSGTAHVAYIPKEDGKVVGLSKLARLVDAFARRLQVQERMTSQIAQALEEALDPRGVAVIVKAQHSCQALRGIKKPGWMVTSDLRGYFRENRDGARVELLKLIEI